MLASAVPERSARFFDRRRLVSVAGRGLPNAVLALFLAYYGLLCFRHAWAADFQIYCAAVSRLFADLANPGHETLAAPTSQSTAYTPYLVLIAALGRGAGVTPYRALQFAGLANLLIYVCAVRFLFARYSMHSNHRLAAVCFVAVGLLLHWEHFGWSSEISLLNLQFVQAYPSTLGWSLSFLAFGLVEDLRRRFRLRSALLLSLTLTLLLTVHVLTASWAIGTVGILALHAALARRDPKLLAPTAAAVATALVLADLWPYAWLFGQGSMTRVQEPSRFGAHPWHDLANLYVVAVPSAAWLVLRARRHTVWVWGLAASYVALLSWRALGISFGNRYAFYMGFFAQFMVAEVVAAGLLVMVRARVRLTSALSWARSDSILALFVVLVAVCASLPSPMMRLATSPRSPIALEGPLELLAQPSPHDAYYRRYAALAFYLGPSDVVMTPTTRAVFDIAATTGARFVSSPNAIKVPDVAQRYEAAAMYFRPGVGELVRSTLLERFGVTKVLLPAASGGLLPELRRELGSPIFQDPRMALFAVSPRGLTAELDRR